MARSRSSSWWRYVNPAYYLKRPKKLAMLFIVFVIGTLFVWDRQTLLREHEEELEKLYSEVNRLHDELEGVKNVAGIKNDILAKKVVSDDPLDVERRQKVKEAMLHAWTSYEKYAWGQDELQPQSKSGVNSFGGLGATLIDSLDTLYIMGLDEQFQRAREWVANTLDFNKDYDASVFETTIRVVGGLLSAYDLSNDKMFLEKAQDIADRLLPAWDTSSGIPYNIINLAHGRPHNPGWTGHAVSIFPQKPMLKLLGILSFGSCWRCSSLYVTDSILNKGHDLITYSRRRRKGQQNRMSENEQQGSPQAESSHQADQHHPIRGEL